MKVDKYILILIFSVFIAWLFPQPATDKSGIILSFISTIGISLIFFFYGLRLSYEKIKLGIKNWRLHILVQTSTYLIFPLVVLILHPFIQNEQQEILWLGLFFLAAVPSTVSLSVVMVSISRGNIPAAIFNASISGIIGIIITPLWMGLFLQQTQVGLDFTDIYLRLTLGIILPIIIGLLMQRKLYSIALKHNKKLGVFEKSVTIMIVYKSFATSFSDAVFASVDLTDMIVTVLIVIALFFLIYGIVYTISTLLKFNREDKIAALFCGSQKSLIHGTVFSNIIFSGFHAAGLMLVPLMLFHSFQIFISSVIASRFGTKYKK